MHSRLFGLPVALVAAVVVSAQTSAPASLMTQESVNVFRRFSIDREKDLAFYADVIGLQPLNALNMPGGGQMSLFHKGTSQFKFTGAGAGRQEKTGPVLDVTGLRVFTFFFQDETAVTTRFTSHGLAAPEFHEAHGRRSAMVTDPDGQWVELVSRRCDDGCPADDFEIGATVSDLEKSRAFYRDFVGLMEMPATDTMFGKTYHFQLGPRSINVLNLWAAHPGAAANTYTAGIQYVVNDVEAIDARGKAANVKITQPLGPFGQGLRTVWMADPDGITNYFAQILRTPRTVTP